MRRRSYKLPSNSIKFGCAIFIIALSSGVLPVTNGFLTRTHTLLPTLAVCSGYRESFSGYTGETANTHNWSLQGFRSSSNRSDEDPKDGSVEECIDSGRRRNLLRRLPLGTAGLVVSWTTFENKAAHASAVRGPMELLRPACRVKVYIETAIDLCRQIKASPKTITKDSLQLLSIRLLENPNPSFMTPEEETLSRRYLEIDTTTGWQRARLKEREARGAENGVDYTTPYDRFNTAVQQFGDRRTFQILRERQLNLEKKDNMRAAFNAYTNNIVFGDSYQLNVSGDEKKALVRSDALPNVNSVVVSDLDLRDLYRNQILQNIGDARDEVAYQLSDKYDDGDVDVDEILKYLQAALSSCDEWFGFIPADDVAVASNFVSKETKKIP